MESAFTAREVRVPELRESAQLSIRYPKGGEEAQEARPLLSGKTKRLVSVHTTDSHSPTQRMRFEKNLSGLQLFLLHFPNGGEKKK